MLSIADISPLLLEDLRGPTRRFAAGWPTANGSEISGPSRETFAQERCRAGPSRETGPPSHGPRLGRAGLQRPVREACGRDRKPACCAPTAPAPAKSEARKTAPEKAYQPNP